MARAWPANPRRVVNTAADKGMVWEEKSPRKSGRVDSGVALRESCEREAKERPA